MPGSLRPTLTILDAETVDGIIAEAREILASQGFRLANAEAAEILAEAGARRDPQRGRVFLTDRLMDRALETCPGVIRLYDRDGREAALLGWRNMAAV